MNDIFSFYLFVMSAIVSFVMFTIAIELILESYYDKKHKRMTIERRLRNMRQKTND